MRVNWCNERAIARRESRYSFRWGMYNARAGSVDVARSRSTEWPRKVRPELFVGWSLSCRWDGADDGTYGDDVTWRGVVGGGG